MIRRAREVAFIEVTTEPPDAERLDNPIYLAMLEGVPGGDGTTWLEPVTDEQYQAAHQR